MKYLKRSNHLTSIKNKILRKPISFFVILKHSILCMTFICIGACGHKNTPKTENTTSQDTIISPDLNNDSQREIAKMQREVVVTNPDELIDSAASK